MLFVIATGAIAWCRTVSSWGDAGSGFPGIQRPAALVRKHINRALEPVGRAVAVVGGTAHLTMREATGVIVEPFISKGEMLDFDTVQMEIARALLSIQKDPEDAVTAGCSQIETVCRSVLLELGRPVPSKKDIDGLTLGSRT